LTDLITVGKDYIFFIDGLMAEDLRDLDVVVYGWKEHFEPLHERKRIYPDLYPVCDRDQLTGRATAPKMSLCLF
jgi:hypothetical protein